MPTQDVLNSLLSYNPDTGLLTAKVCRGTRHAGDVVGSTNKLGYVHHRINNSNFLVHRIIWTMLYGPIPKRMVIDHINGNPSDNRLSNLRLVSHQDNMRNAALPRNNISGARGVDWSARRKRWRARITIDQKDIDLGLHKTFEQAAARRKQAELDNGFHPNHGRLMNIHKEDFQPPSATVN